MIHRTIALPLLMGRFIFQVASHGFLWGGRHQGPEQKVHSNLSIQLFTLQVQKEYHFHFKPCSRLPGSWQKKGILFTCFAGT